MEHNKRKKQLTIPKGEIDFAQAAKEHGFVKARQMLKQSSVQAHQNKINKADLVKYEVKKVSRVVEAVRLSTTLGQPSNETAIEKIVEAASRRIEPKEGLTEDEAQRHFDCDVALQRAIIAEDCQLLIPQCELECLPIGLGDTLYLQTSYLRGISLPRNKLTTFMTEQIPQLSTTHLRYVTTLNLSGNKITRLPQDFGCMLGLEYLDLSGNLLSKLPSSISQISLLTTLDLSKNNFSDLSDDLGNIRIIKKLNLSDNLFVRIPTPLLKMCNTLEHLDLSRNSLQHMAILPQLMKPSDLWHHIVDLETGKQAYLNVLTREKIRDLCNYSGRGLERAKDLHVFQSPGTRSYRRRRIWLSISQVHEWDPVEDNESGWIYYRNNVSGETQWDMPPDLDTLGTLTNLEVLFFNQNSIRALANSIVALTKLKKLVIIKNKVAELPADIGNMISLEHLNLNSNELKLLPTSICNCSSLTTLVLPDNLIVRLPDMLGTLPRLCKLDATANRLKQIPFSLGYCASLSEVSFQENPLVDPPVDELQKGLEKLKWYLRSRLLIDKQGMPPPMQFHTLGIMDEVVMYKPQFIERIRGLMALVQQSGLLNLQLMGLRDIPRMILKLGKILRKLQLDFNSNLQLIDGIPIELSSLKLLSFRACKMAALPENISCLKKLTTLNCESNLFEELPASFTKLKSLMTLDMSKNNLYSLPAGFEALVSLKYLNLESNNLEVIPPGLGLISSMLTLNLSKNRLSDMPEMLCELVGLKKLNMERNRLYNVPARISQMNIIELRIGHNRIEYLEDDIFDHELGRSVKFFSCCENNIMELPYSIRLIDAEGQLEADYNPLVSPPSYLLSEGLNVVQSYMQIRYLRLAELEELLDDEDFDFDKSATSPQACEVLQDGTGFLHPQDLLEFDQAIDEFINGEFFKCPATAEELVSSVTKLRDFRETDLYHTILTGTLQVLENITKMKDKRFSEAVLLSSQRPWGRKGEKCSVWVLSLGALLKEAPPNQFQKNGRPSVLSMINEALPDMPFPFTVELLKDSMRLYVSPYGQVADTEQMTFPSCDCIDDQRFKPKRHNPCEKAAIVLVKSIYSDEEAQRRDIEDDEFMMRFEDLDGEIRIWLHTEEGKKCLSKEVRRRQGLLKENIQLRDEMVEMEDFKIKKLRSNTNQLKHRKQQFEEGEAFEVHGFHDVGEAIKAIAAEEEKTTTAVKRLEALQLSVLKLRDDANLDLAERKRLAGNDLVQKYCSLNYTATVKGMRVFAAQRNVRRPWDGEDGIEYTKWLKKFGKKGVNLKNLTLDQILDNEEDSDLKQDKPEDAAEYDWALTDDMARFTFPLYSRYAHARDLALRATAKIADLTKSMSTVAEELARSDA